VPDWALLSGGLASEWQKRIIVRISTLAPDLFSAAQKAAGARSRGRTSKRIYPPPPMPPPISAGLLAYCVMVWARNGARNYRGDGDASWQQRRASYQVPAPTQLLSPTQLSR
jgi:hypothetical protein